MSHKDHNAKKAKTRRPLFFVLLGILLFATAGVLIADRTQTHTSIAPAPRAYHYVARQSFDNSVHYQQSSFFSSTPGAANTAYLSDLTDTINSQLHYTFHGSEPTDLQYTYSVKALIQSIYGSRTSDDSAANVWSQQYTLLEPVDGSRKTDSLKLTPTVTIPFTDYKQKSEQFKNAFSAAVTSQLVVTFTVHVSGTFNNTPFDDNKTSTITMPLDQEVYKLATKYLNQEQHDVIPAKSLRLADVITRYEIAVATALIIAGMACSMYGIRKQIIKSPHQRELEKIYRYHDGIIIKAHRLTNLANKNVVMVQSFEDLLNIEEEIKAPIIASKVSDATTHFLITRDDIVYVYTLGDPVPFKPPTDSGKPPTPPATPPQNFRRVSG